jgi:hypothetical protein
MPKNSRGKTKTSNKLGSETWLRLYEAIMDFVDENGGEVNFRISGGTITDIHYTCGKIKEKTNAERNRIP